MIIIQYDGCYYHQCDCIEGKKSNKFRKSKIHDEKRNECLSKYGKLIILKTCEFRKLEGTPLFISPLLYKGTWKGMFAACKFNLI